MYPRSLLLCVARQKKSPGGLYLALLFCQIPLHAIKKKEKHLLTFLQKEGIVVVALGCVGYKNEQHAFTPLSESS